MFQILGSTTLIAKSPVRLSVLETSREFLIFDLILQTCSTQAPNHPSYNRTTKPEVCWSSKTFKSSEGLLLAVGARWDWDLSQELFLLS